MGVFLFYNTLIISFYQKIHIFAQHYFVILPLILLLWHTGMQVLSTKLMPVLSPKQNSWRNMAIWTATRADLYLSSWRSQAAQPSEE